MACVAAAVGADLPLARRALETLAAGGWVRMAGEEGTPRLSKDRAPSASLHHPKAEAAPTHPGAPPAQL